jgi:hypothetical protein
MTCHGPARRPRPLRRPRRLFVSMSLLGLGLCAPAAASASPVPVSSAGASGFYSWCGGKTLQQGLLPDATPPAAPTSCSDFTSSTGTLTAQLGAHDAGTLTVSVYLHDDTRPATVALLVGGAQVGSGITAPQAHTGWISFSSTSVSASQAVSVQVKSGSGGSGYLKVYSVHGELTPAPTPAAAGLAPPGTTLGQPGNWATSPIPSGVALASGAAPNGTPLTTAVRQELAGQAAADSWVNRTQYTSGIFYVPAKTPLQPVRLCRYSGQCVPNWGSPAYDLWRAAMGEGNAATFNATTGKPVSDQYIGGGIPIDSTVSASPGSDAEAVICRGGGNSGTAPWTATNADGTPFTRPDGQLIEGDCWEVFGLRPDPTYNPSLPVGPSNTKWMIEWGARHTGFIDQLSSTAVSTSDPLDTLSGTYTRPRDTTWYGPDVATPGAPNSTTYDNAWGVTAARTPLLTDVVSNADCQAVLGGASDFGHAIGIQLQATRNPFTGGGSGWWPASSSDGNSSGVATVEGMRVFFAPNVTMPSGLSPAAQALFHTLQRYGAVVDDQTGGGPAVTYAADGSYQSGGALMIRSQLDLTGAGSCTQLGMGSALTGIPWAQISGPIAAGSDATPTPTS